MPAYAEIVAFLLTLIAGLCTGAGSLVALTARRTNTKLLAASLGFSAGVMVYVSFVGILAKAQESLVHELGKGPGSWLAVGSFFSGVALAALLDRMVPDFENPHEPRRVEEMAAASLTLPRDKIFRMGAFSALVIGLHNFPEGLATFVAALKDPALGVSIAAAIAIHNIPEGIAVSVPIFFATGSRAKAFGYSFASGLAEPAGALIGYMLLRPFLNETVFGIVFAGVAGIMVFIALDELLPGAREYGEHHIAVYGLIGGMAVMAVSVLFFM